MANLNLGQPLILGGVDRIVITKYDSSGDLESDFYTLTQIVEDTTSITQEDADTSEILSEKGEVLKSLSTPGSRTFTAESGNINEAILTGLFGYRKAADGELVAPQGDPNIEAKVEIYLAGGAEKIICHKVKFANSVTVESLRTDIVRGVITGTLLAVDVDQLLPTPTGTPDMREFGFASVTP